MNKRHQLFAALSSRKIAMLGLGLAVSAALAGTASADPNVTDVTKCETISKAGFYRVTKSITATGSGDCLAIKGSNVTLDIYNPDATSGDVCDGTTITGKSGTGVGIHIYGHNVFVEGQNSIITQFKYGLEDDGTGNRVDFLNLSGNKTAGLYLDGSSSKDTNFFSGTIFHTGTSTPCFSSSQTYGVYVSADKSFVGGGVLEGNNTGLYETGASGTRIVFNQAESNGIGFQAQGGTGNQIYNDQAFSNTKVGILVCAGTPLVTPCGAVEKNSIFTELTGLNNNPPTGPDFEAIGDPFCNNNKYFANPPANFNNVSPSCLTLN